MSPLLVIVFLIPLLNILKKYDKGYLLKHGDTRVNHGLYMDDLQLYGKSKAEVKALVNVMRKYPHDICIRFGLQKCASMTME